MNQTVTISIVDDDESVREATSGLVRSLGYTAATFASADEFLSSNRVDDTSCLITDVRMPGLNGIELQRRLIAQGHSIPTIFVTAFAEEGIRLRVMNAGAIGFLSKPVNEKDMIRCLELALKDSNNGNAIQ